MTDEVVHDSLTSLPNRKFLLERVGVSLVRAKRHKSYLFAVLFLDLDRFKFVNDGMGHEAGDRLLIEVGHRLEGCIRAVDSVAWFGGDKY
ncbi:MAG: diguanylate cyclase domain-containing protein, partial [Terriglobia bacterium]